MRWEVEMRPIPCRWDDKDLLEVHVQFFKLFCTGYLILALLWLRSKLNTTAFPGWDDSRP